MPRKRRRAPAVLPNLPGNSRFGGITMGKHAIGGMRSMMVPNRKADMRRRKKAYLRNKERAEADRQKKGGAVKNATGLP